MKKFVALILPMMMLSTICRASATYNESNEAVGESDFTLPLASFTDAVANADGTYSFTGTDTYGWFNLWYGDDSGLDGTPADWSDYTYLVAEVAVGSDPVRITIEYASDYRVQASGAAGTTISMTLDEECKSSVSQLAIQFQAHWGTHTAIISKIYLTNTLGDKIIDNSNWCLWHTTYGANVEVEVDDAGVAEFYCYYDWGWFYNYLGGVDCFQYNYLVVEFSEPTTIPIKLGVEYTNDTNGTWQDFDAGTTTACVALSEDYKDSIKDVVIQNGTGSEGSTFYVSNAYFSVDEVETVTGIRNVASFPANSAIFNLHGQRVDSSYKGLVIKNGKKMIVR